MEVLLVFDLNLDGLHQVVGVRFVFSNFLDFFLLRLFRLVDFLLGVVHQRVHFVFPPFLLLTVGFDRDDFLLETLDLLVVLHVFRLQLLQIISHVFILGSEIAEPRIDSMKTF